MKLNQEHIILEIILFSNNVEKHLEMAQKNNILNIQYIKTDLEFLKQKKLTTHDQATENIGPFISVCRDKYGMDLSNILEEVFQNEIISELTLAWHDGEHFVANFFWNYENGRLRNKKLKLEYNPVDDKFKVETSSETLIIQIENQKLKRFLIGQLTTPQELDLRKIVGCGGESVVVIAKDDSSKTDKVVKM